MRNHRAQLLIAAAAMGCALLAGCGGQQQAATPAFNNVPAVKGVPTPNAAKPETSPERGDAVPSNIVGAPKTAAKK